MSTSVALPLGAPGTVVSSVQPSRLFAASCMALATSAFTFVIRSDVLQDMGNSFGLSQAGKGWLEGSLFLGLAVSMLAGGIAGEIIGFGKVLVLTWVCHLLSIIGMMTAPAGEMGFPWLVGSSFLMGCANGLVDAAVTPLVATLFSHRKTEYLNRLHAWFPAGLVIGGLASRGLHGWLGLDWRLTVGLILLPCVGYGLLILGQRFPETEREETGVSRSTMYRQALRPGFLLLMFAAILAHGTEVAPQKWFDSVLSCTAGVSGTLVLVYTGALMFVMRQFAGPVSDTLTPPGMLVASAALAGIGLYLLSTATTGVEAFAYATLYGIGIGRMWPTLLGVTAERFPAGGAFVLALLGLAGNLSTSQVMPLMGHTFDRYAVHQLTTDNPELAARVAGRGTLDPDTVGRLSEGERAIVQQAQGVGAAMIYRWACVLPAMLIAVLIFGVVRFRPTVGSPLNVELESSTV